MTRFAFITSVNMWLANDEVDLEDIRLNTIGEPPEKASIRVLVPLKHLPNFEKQSRYRVTFTRIQQPHVNKP